MERLYLCIIYVRKRKSNSRDCKGGSLCIQLNISFCIPGEGAGTDSLMKLNATLQGIKSATGFDSVPTLLIEFPIILQEKIKMEELPPEFSYKETVVADKVYIAGKLK